MKTDLIKNVLDNESEYRYIKSNDKLLKKVLHI